MSAYVTQMLCTDIPSKCSSLLFTVDAPKPPTGDTYLRFDEYGSTGRPRRSAGKSQTGLNVETLVVADKKMVEKHGKANVTTYILTVMNMVRGVSGLQPSCLSTTARKHRTPRYGLTRGCSPVFFLREKKVLKLASLYIDLVKLKPLYI